MNDASRANAAPDVAYLRKGDDVLEVRLSPFTDKDITELDHWIQAQMLRRVRESVEGEPKQVRDEAMALAMRESLTITWLSGIGARMAASVEGLTRLLWQATRKTNPDLTIEKLREFMYSPESIDEANRAFTRLNKNILSGGPPKGNPHRPHHGAKSTAPSEKSMGSRRRKSRR